jgi:hypothetical protein
LKISLEPDRLKAIKVYVRQPRDLVQDVSRNFRITIQDAAGSEAANYVASFNAPEFSR